MRRAHHLFSMRRAVYAFLSNPTTAVVVCTSLLVLFVWGMRAALTAAQAHLPFGAFLALCGAIVGACLLIAAAADRAGPRSRR
jgi:hypothetical protein